MAKQDPTTIECGFAYAQVNRENDLSKKFQVVLTNLDKKTCTKLEKFGISVQTGDGDKEAWGSYVTGKSKFEIPVYDSKGNKVDSEAVSIGNGSTGRAKIIPVDNAKYSNVGVGLQAIQVLKLVEYEAACPFDTEEGDDGFVAEDEDADDDGEAFGDAE